MTTMQESKKSQVIFLGIGIAIMVLITVIALIPPLKDSIIIARDVSHLDCTNTSISTGQQATCIVIDFWLFYFVITALGAGFAYVTGMSIYNQIRQ